LPCTGQLTLKQVTQILVFKCTQRFDIDVVLRSVTNAVGSSTVDGAGVGLNKV